jgi:hypothetical protein
VGWDLIARRARAKLGGVLFLSLPRRRRNDVPTVTIKDSDGVSWSVHTQERREAVLSIDRSNHQVERRPYLIFVSEFGKRRRSREPAADGWEKLPEWELRELLASSVGLPPNA